MRRLLIASIPLLFACALFDSAGAPATSVSTPPESPTLAPEPTLPLAPTPSPSPIPDATALPDPAGFHWAPVTGGLLSPVDLQNAGDERLFIVEQHGVIRVFDEAGLRDEPFLDLRDRVFDEGNEQGLLGLAFHPSFVDNGSFYVNYTTGDGDTVIARFTAGEGPTVDPATEKLLLTYDQPYPNHNGGGIAFGPDGMLYIGSGDGGAAGDPEERAQNLDTLLGKLLRIDVDGGDPYAIPPDNPFAAGGGRPEIWAYGLRNPWRFAFDPQTGDLFIADVGQNQWEEIDFLPAGAPGGANFGWDFREGFELFEGLTPPGLVDPLAVYSHSEGCSVTGGVVVRDPALPEWNGVYLYGDFCSGLIWGLVRDANGVWQNGVLFGTAFQITSFGVGHDGRVYVLDRGGGVYRLERSG